jgi:hypothetical protein
VSILTAEERLRQIDQTVEEVKQSFVDALEQGFLKPAEELAQSEEVAPAFHERLAEIAERLRALPGELEPTSFGPESLHELHNTLHEMRDLMRELEEKSDDRLEILNELLIGIERIRHIIRDAIDEHVTGISSDAGGVLNQLSEWLPGIPQREIAQLLSVHPRTLLRWSQQPARPQRRLQLLAQLVAILRHGWTPEGVVAWFARPNRDLGNRKPGSLLGDPAYERDLIMAARATRSQ